jgi:RNA polymerase sigma-70 factor, ECF subfamily
MPSMPLIDVWLVHRARAGNRRSFEKLYDRHVTRIYNLLRRLTGDATVTEDLTQETFIAAYGSLGSWRGQGAFSTWLCGIAVRQYCQHRRCTRDEEPLTDDTLPYDDTTSDPFAHSEGARVLQALETAIAALPILYREAFTLTYVEEFSYKEVAAFLDIPVGTVQSRLNKAKTLLRAHLTPLLADEETVAPTLRPKGDLHVL